MKKALQEIPGGLFRLGKPKHRAFIINLLSRKVEGTGPTTP